MLDGLSRQGKAIARPPEPQVFHERGRRRAKLVLEPPTEMARAQARALGKDINRKPLAHMALYPRDKFPELVRRFHLELQRL